MKGSIKKNGRPSRSVVVSIVALLALQGAFAAPARADLLGMIVDPGTLMTVWSACNTAIAGFLANLPRPGACAPRMGETPPKKVTPGYAEYNRDGGIVNGGNRRDRTPDGHAADYASNLAGAEQSGALSR